MKCKKLQSIDDVKKVILKESNKGDVKVLEEEKKVLDPEGDILLNQSLNAEVQTIEDSLNTDGVNVVSEETTDDKLNRELLTANEEGKQPEGMVAPIEEFENDGLRRQGYY